MSNELIIAGQEIFIKELNEKRVVTFKDIDSLHKRVDGTASRNFRENRTRFIENTDYYVLEVTSDEIRREFNLNKHAGNEVILITESGYLMLVKSFNDELAWKVQRELINNYFNVRQNSISEVEFNLLMEIYKKQNEELKQDVEELKQIGTVKDKIIVKQAVEIENYKNQTVGSKNQTVIGGKETLKIGSSYTKQNEIVQQNIIYGVREKELLNADKLLWNGKDSILDMIKKYANYKIRVLNFDRGYAYGSSWNEFKYELIQKDNINLDERKTKNNDIRTMDSFYSDGDLLAGMKTAMELCKNNGVNVEDVLDHYRVRKSIIFSVEDVDFNLFPKKEEQKKIEEKANRLLLENKQIRKENELLKKRNEELQNREVSIKWTRV